MLDKGIGHKHAIVGYKDPDYSGPEVPLASPSSSGAVSSSGPQSLSTIGAPFLKGRRTQMPRRRGRGNAHVCMNPGLGKGSGGKLILRRHTVPEGVICAKEWV